MGNHRGHVIISLHGDQTPVVRLFSVDQPVWEAYMVPVIVIVLLMGLVLVVSILKPEIGMQFKQITERMAYEAEWRPTQRTKWRFVLSGILIEAVFLAVLIVFLLKK
jgi:NADH:ubiquinone oxidoreductase subunit 3 (subunit A)